MPLPTAYLALGCNRGDRFAALNRACALLVRHGVGVLRRSSIFVTRPMGAGNSPARCAEHYFNAVVEARAPLGPLELYWRCRAVEREMGRLHRERWEPRVMDVDLVFFGGFTMRHPDLVLPHPGWRSRDFVLAGLVELGVPAATRFMLERSPERCIETRLPWV